MTVLLLSSEGHEGEPIGTAALLTDPKGNALVIADVTSWDLNVYDRSLRGIERDRPIYSELGVDPGVTNTNGTPDGALVISDTVRLDGYWKGPPPGYNFLRYILPSEMAAYVPPFTQKGGHAYLLEFIFTTTWEEIVLRHVRTTIPLASA